MISFVAWRLVNLLQCFSSGGIICWPFGHPSSLLTQLYIYKSLSDMDENYHMDPKFKLFKIDQSAISVIQFGKKIFLLTQNMRIFKLESTISMQIIKLLI